MYYADGNQLCCDVHKTLCVYCTTRVTLEKFVDPAVPTFYAAVPLDLLNFNYPALSLIFDQLNWKLALDADANAVDQQWMDVTVM